MEKTKKGATRSAKSVAAAAVAAAVVVVWQTKREA